MTLIPSLLEYSPVELSSKLAKLKDLDETRLHLDFVCKYFAQDRVVMGSLSQKTVMDALELILSDRKLYLSVHIMANLQDTVQEVYGFWHSYKLNPNWYYDMFFPVAILENHNILRSKKQNNMQNGVWFDLDEWSQNPTSVVAKLDELGLNSCLLMTVKAGRAGQKLESKIKNVALQLAIENPQINFTLDGGWPLETDNQPQNVKIVGYSSYWNSLELIT